MTSNFQRLLKHFDSVLDLFYGELPNVTLDQVREGTNVHQSHPVGRGRGWDQPANAYFARGFLDVPARSTSSLNCDARCLLRLVLKAC